jgi:hypothetical protein
MARLMPLRPPRPPGADDQLKHVIAEYKHRAQTVTCVCGWHGSSAAELGQSSEWAAHVAENRPKRP